MSKLITAIINGDEALLRDFTFCGDLQENGVLWILVSTRNDELVAGHFGIDISDAAKISSLDSDKKIKYAQILLDGGVNLNTKYGNKSLINHAVSNCNYSILELLLKRGLGLHGGTDNTCDDPIRCAINVDHKRILRLLLESGINPNVKDPEGYTTFTWICHLGFKNYRSLPDPEVIDLFLEYSDVNIADNQGMTPLSHAVKDCVEHAEDFQLAMTLKIIQSGKADVNYCSETGLTPLMFAVLNKNVTIAKALIQAGSKVYEEDKNGRTALHHVVKESNARPIIDLLVDAGFDININNGRQPPPLYVAAKAMQSGNVLHLLQLNADVPTTFEKYNLSKLHMIDVGSQIMALLIFAGHDWDFVPQSYKFPRRFAVCGGTEIPDFEQLLCGDILDNYRERVSFADKMTRPVTLKFICRWNIRKKLGLGIKDKITRLDVLPQVLKNFLMLPELEWLYEVFKS